MGNPSAIDADFDFKTDVVYIGATINQKYGKMYRLNMLGSPASGWDLTILYEDNGNPFMGPVTVEPSASKDLFSDKIIVYFGTGKLKNKDDMVTTERQRFYAIRDGCWIGISDGPDCTPTGGDPNYNYVVGDLFDASTVLISYTGGEFQVDEGATSACGGSGKCSYDDLIQFVKPKDGWFLNLRTDPDGIKPSERALARGALISTLMLFTTYTPTNDVCSLFGNGRFYAVNYLTGTAYREGVFEKYLTDSDGNYILDGDGNKIDANTEGIIRDTDIGAGMPTAVGVAVGESVTGFVQKSTGEVVRIQADFAGIGDIKSSTSSWREGSSEGEEGIVEIELIYKHIVR